MWTNLIRFRLLDFFELTAAIAGALYVYKSGWWEFEKTWIASALAIAALVIWIATRLGKTAPTPGVFLAAYAGALYGLSDLSPWMVVFGRLAILETAHSLFPGALPVHGSQEQIRVVAITFLLMAVPALLFGCAAASAGTTISIIRKTWKWPTSLLGRTAIVLQSAMALTFLAGLSYYSLRPQIRHVATIRIPIIDKEQSENHFSASSIIAWTIADSGKSLIAIRSDNRHFEYELPTGHQTRDVSLDGELFITDRHYFVHENDITFARKRHLSGGLDLGHVHRWTNHEGRQILVVLPDFFGPPYRFFDAVTGEKLPLRVPLPSAFSQLTTTSASGRFVIYLDDTPGGSRDDHMRRFFAEPWPVEKNRIDPNDSPLIAESEEATSVKFTVIDLELLIQTEKYAVDPRDEQIIDSAGRRSVLKGAKARRRQQWLNSSIKCLRGHYPGQATLSETKDGKWQLSPLGLQSKGNDEKLLVNYMQFDLHAMMDEASGRVALSATSNNDSILYGPTPTRIPIVEALLENAQNGQITLFDPNTNSASTSWLRRGIMKNQHLESAKFTPDGRYFIIQDEDESADLFHVFAMP